VGGWPDKHKTDTQMDDKKHQLIEAAGVSVSVRQGLIPWDSKWDLGTVVPRLSKEWTQSLETGFHYGPFLTRCVLSNRKLLKEDGGLSFSKVIFGRECFQKGRENFSRSESNRSLSYPNDGEKKAETIPGGAPWTGGVDKGVVLYHLWEVGIWGLRLGVKSNLDERTSTEEAKSLYLKQILMHNESTGKVGW